MPAMPTRNDFNDFAGMPRTPLTQEGGNIDDELQLLDAIDSINEYTHK